MVHVSWPWHDRKQSFAESDHLRQGRADGSKASELDARTHTRSFNTEQLPSCRSNSQVQLVQQTEEEEYVKNTWSFLIDSSNWKREGKSKINKKYKDVLNTQNYLSWQNTNLYNIFLNDESFGRDCIQRIFSYYNGLYNIKFSIISNKEDTEIVMWSFIKV
jgi:hypothetical protein